MDFLKNLGAHALFYGGVIAIFLIGGYIGTAHFWLIGALILFAVAEFLAEAFDPSNEVEQLRRAPLRGGWFLTMLFRSISFVALWLAVGIGVLVIVRLIMAFGYAPFLTRAEIADWELWLAERFEDVRFFLNPQNTLALLLFAVVIAMIAPNLRPVQRLVALRGSLGRLGLMLLAATSFTFLGVSDLAGNYASVSNSERYKLQRKTREAREMRAEIMAAALVQEKFENLESNESAELARFFSELARTGTKTRTMRLMVRQMAASIPDQKARIQAETPPGTPVSSTISERKNATAIATTQVSRLAEARTAAREAVIETVTSVMPGVRVELIEVFVSEFNSNLSRRLISHDIPTRIQSIAHARTALSASPPSGSQRWLLTGEALFGRSFLQSGAVEALVALTAAKAAANARNAARYRPTGTRARPRVRIRP